MFPLLEFLEKDMEHDMFKLYAKWFSARDNGEKGAGFHVFMFFIFPLFFLSLFILHCIRRCLCGKKVQASTSSCFSSSPSSSSHFSSSTASSGAYAGACAGFHVFMFFIFPLFFLSLFILHCIL